MAEKLKNIEIKGKSYPVWGGFYAIEQFELLTGLSGAMIMSSVTSNVVFTWCSMWAGAKMQEVEFKLTLDEFKAMINEAPEILDLFKEEADPKKLKRTEESPQKS